MRSARLSLYLLVGFLIAIGAVTTLYEVLALGLPFQASTAERLWTVEAKITFQARSGRPVIAQFLLPRSSPDLIELSESFVSRNYGLNIEPEGANRKATWSIRRTRGEQILYYRLVIAPRTGTQASVPGPKDDAVQPPVVDGAEKVAIQGLLDSIRSQSANVRTFTAKTIRVLNDAGDNNARLLIGRERTPINLARVAVLVLTSARIPAREVHAVPLKDGTRIEPLVLVSTWDGERWSYFDPLTGVRMNPAELLLWWEGEQPLLSVEGGRRESVEFSVSTAQATALTLAQEAGRLEGSRWIEFSPMSLPLETQQLYQIVLMLPIGVGIIVLLRTFVGIETFGTFMPALVALAFRETQLVWGVVLFALLVTIGMSVRWLLDHLKLLLVPRLAAVLTIVVLVMAAISVLTNKLGLDRGLSVALFPMVIITMTIERMAIVWEERGGTRALGIAGGSLLAAAVAYLAMTNAFLTHLVFTFPGLLLVLIALLLLAGSYRGYRLTELTRFRELARARE